MSKYTVPTDQQAEILRKNSIDPDVVMVVAADDRQLHVLNLHTRADIIIYF